MQHKFFRSDVWQGLLSLSPFALIFFLASFWEPLFSTVPDKKELTVISGSANVIRKNSGSINTPDGVVAVSYECLCNYGWGEKSFEKGLPVYALGALSNGGYRIWELKIGQDQVFTYDDYAHKELEKINSAKSIAVPGIVVSILLMLLLGIRKLKERKSQKNYSALFALLDDLADNSKQDSERLGALDEILCYEKRDFIEALEFIAMNNTNSEFFLSKVGCELGKLWSGMEIQEIEAITYVQPAAKISAVKVMKSQNTELHSQLQEIGAVTA